MTTVERADVHAALERLNERDRQLIRLRYEEDLTQTAIASRLGMPEGTVKVRLHRVRTSCAASWTARRPCTAERFQRPELATAVQRRGAVRPPPFDNEDDAPPDRGLRWRWLLDGVRQPAARRLRARALRTGERPQVCFLPSASGDADHYIVRFYRAFAADRCEASHISLFRREQGPEDLRDHLLSQDLIYVGGGSVISLLGVWRAHGIDEILREAWEAGVVLCGLSAGSLCWFAEAVTGFHGAPQRVEGLGLLPFSNCVHYEPRLRAAGSPTTTSSARGCAPATPPRTAPRCTSSAPS